MTDELTITYKIRARYMTSKIPLNVEVVVTTDPTLPTNTEVPSCGSSLVFVGSGSSDDAGFMYFIFGTITKLYK